MKLLFVLATILAISLAEESKKVYDDLEAVETIELQKTHDLSPAASTYNSLPSQTWQQPQNSFSQTWYPPNPNPPQNNYVPPQNNYVPPQNNYVPPQNNYVPPQNNYVPPQNNYVPPVNYPVPTQVQSDYVRPQNNYQPQNTWSTTPQYQPSTTTTPVPVIKNEQYYGDNGSYKYEYQIGDGTHVGEEGYLADLKDDESIVKKGWYSYKGADGKTYTVTYWADKTGYHAYGDHLPTPPPVPAAIQVALDQNAKEEAAKAEAEKNKPQYQTTQKPVYYPSQQQQTGYYPPQQQQTGYYPQQTYYPSQQQYGK